MGFLYDLSGSKTINLTVESPSTIFYRGENKHSAHMVIVKNGSVNGEFFDADILNSIVGEDTNYTITQVDPNKFFVSITTSLNQIDFNSLGGLNEITTYGDYYLIPSNATNLTLSFVVPFNSNHTIYILGFETNSSDSEQLKNSTFSNVPTTPRMNVDVKGASALSIFDVNTLNYYDRQVKASLGNPYRLPDVYNRTYAVFFMLNNTVGINETVAVNLSMNDLMEAYSFQSTNVSKWRTSSPYLTAGTFYGGTVNYSDSIIGVPFEVDYT